MVTAASLASMGVSALSTFVLPIIILVVARRRWCCSLWSAAVGALVFVVFALLLEGGLHALVFAALPNLPSKPMLYTIYAALAAGVCEELGRVCGFAVLQASDRRPDGVGRALGAGIGHGGIEAILLVGVATISHLVISVEASSMRVRVRLSSLACPTPSAISWPASSNCSSIRLRRSTC